MTTELKYFAVLFEHNGEKYEKLMGAETEKEAKENYNFMFGDEPAISVKECSEKDCGTFYHGVRKL